MIKQILFILLNFQLSACALTAGARPYPTNDHYDGSRFFNPGGPGTKGFSELLKWQWKRQQAKWPERVAIKAPPRIPLMTQEQEAQVTFIGHSTFLIQTKELNILTDPVFSERVSPVSWAGPKRVSPPALTIDQLPKIDLVLISHNHYDHMDLPSLKALAERFNPLFLVPLGNKEILTDDNIARVEELDWWQAYRLSSTTTINLVPAQHWSSRGLFDRNRSLWGGFFVYTQGLKIYFAGDTGYAPLFKEIANRLGSPDLSLLPIGAYEPRWFMKDFHMGPDEAVLAHIDLGSRQSLGMHFGAFQLSDEALTAPADELKEALTKHNLPQSAFMAPQPEIVVTVRTPSVPSQQSVVSGGSGPTKTAPAEKN